MIENRNPKILILVLCSRKYLSYISSKAQKKIWNDYEKIFNIQHFIGNPYINQRELDYISSNDSSYLLINTDDGYPNLAKKTLLAFEHAVRNFEFDYLFRTNTSSFVDLKKLSQFVKNNSRNLNYSGVVLDVIEGDTIASGAGFFLSRKNIELILQNDDKFDSSLPDDVAIARILKKFNISPKSLPRRDLKSIPKPNTVFEGSDFHYRCRLDPQFHRILEPLLLRYLNLASQKKGFVINFYFYYLSLIFKISNFKIINKILQKYYSFKFYGEFNFGDKILFSIK